VSDSITDPPPSPPPGATASGSTDRDPLDRDPLDRDDVAKVARLAMLELSDAELDRFTGQLDAVLDLAGKLDAFDVDDVPPTAHPFGLTNVLRPDVAEPTDDAASVRAEALQGGPEIEGDRFKVPPALGEAP
jgi:aspartyl-tRNA(Asn)/glutamyl-tRNA(Gln) amidotransferase subunit C